MSTLSIIQPFQFRKFDVPEATAIIDWVSFDRSQKQAQVIYGIYRTPEEAANNENRLDTVALSYQGDEYDNLLAQFPQIYGGIVTGANTLAAQARPDLFKLEEK